jgi:hypothetical protein
VVYTLRASKAFTCSSRYTYLTLLIIEFYLFIYENSTTIDELDFSTLVEASKLNKQAFNFNKQGAQWSSLASRKAKSRATSVIMDAIVKAGTKDQQALALRKACLHPSISQLTETAG